MVELKQKMLDSWPPCSCGKGKQGYVWLGSSLLGTWKTTYFILKLLGKGLSPQEVKQELMRYNLRSKCKEVN